MTSFWHSAVKVPFSKPSDNASSFDDIRSTMPLFAMARFDTAAEDGDTVRQQGRCLLRIFLGLFRHYLLTLGWTRPCSPVAKKHTAATKRSATDNKESP